MKEIDTLMVSIMLMILFVFLYLQTSNTYDLNMKNILFFYMSMLITNKYSKIEARAMVRY